MKELSKIRSAVAPSATLAVNSKFKQMKAEGIPVVGFGAGEPDFDTPDHIKEAGIRAIREGQTKYTPTPGTIEARKAVAYRMKEDLGVDFDYDAIVISNGAKACLYATFFTLLDTGDEVIVPAPYWVSYTEQIRMVGGVPVIVPTTEAQHFKMTPAQLEAAITDKTKALVLNSPNNPTGAVYTEASLAAVCRAVGDRPIFILCDDVYRGLCTRPCPDPAALPGLRERLLIAQSFSKPWAMTGWRIGYLMGSAPVIRKLTALHGHILTCAPSMLQAACETALETDTAPMRETYAKRRALVLRRLHAMGLCCPVPEGAFYAFPDIRAFGLRSEEFCLRLIAEAGVAAVPGSCFGTGGHIRISYCCGEQTLERGMDRLEAFLEKLKQERRT